MKRFLITGIGRSGTKYLSTVFSAIQAACGWDRQFSVFRQNVNWTMPPYGDASWLAFPSLDRLPAGTIVFHVVRDPLHWINSWCKVSPGWTQSMRSFVDDWCGFYNWSNGDHPKVDMRLWCAWNEGVEKLSTNANVVYRRFSIEAFDQATFTSALKLIECPAGQIEVMKVLETTPKNVNASKPKPGFRPYTWADLPAGTELDAFKALAQRYGYGVTDE